jgi:hypothetical protein
MRAVLIAIAMIAMAAASELSQTAHVLARAAPPAADTLGSNATDVVTLRLEGLSVGLVDVVPTISAPLDCRVVAPDGHVTRGIGVGARCHVQWLVPRTGAYRVEIRNRNGNAVPYNVITR